MTWSDLAESALSSDEFRAAMAQTLLHADSLLEHDDDDALSPSESRLLESVGLGATDDRSSAETDDG